MPAFHLPTTAGAMVLAFAITSCAPTARTTDASVPSTPDASPVSTPPQEGESMQTPPPMGKRAAPPAGEVLGPFIGFKGGGEGWRIELFNTSGLAHRTTLTWDSGAKRGEGMLTYQPAGNGSLENKVLEGRLDTVGDSAGHVGKDTTVRLIEDDCTGGDGITHDHTVVVTVSGMAPMRGCGDIAL